MAVLMTSLITPLHLLPLVPHLLLQLYAVLMVRNDVTMRLKIKHGAGCVRVRSGRSRY